LKKEINQLIRRLENAFIKATEISYQVGDQTIPIIQEGLLSLKEALHHFGMAEITEGS